MARTCGNCGGVMQLVKGHDYFHCQYCGGDEQPDRSPDGIALLHEPSGRACPSCRAGLEQAAIGRYQLEHCPRCLGLLLPQPDLRAVVRTLWSDYAGPVGTDGAPAKGSPVDEEHTCPGCAQAMSRQPYLGGGNVIMDVCERCALIWLDRGELRRIVMGTSGV